MICLDDNVLYRPITLAIKYAYFFFINYPTIFIFRWTARKCNAN